MAYMALDIPVILGLAGIFIITGYVSHYIFRRFGFPDIIILLAAGIVVGPVTGLVQRSDIMELIPIISALVMTILLYDGGLNMSYRRVIRGSGRAIIVAATTFVLTMIATAMVTPAILGWDPRFGLLLGAVIGGISASIAVPLANRVSMSQRVSTMLSLESGYTNVFVIIVALALIQIIRLQSGDASLSVNTIMTGIVVGIAVGAAGALAWIRAMVAMKSQYEDILTLAIAFALYGIAEALAGGGPFAALAFGITFGNGQKLFRSLKYELPHVMDTDVEVSARQFQSQIAFMLHVLLFIFLGMMLTIGSTGIILAGIVTSLILFFPRIAASWLSSYNDKELREDSWLMSFMLPRGLAAGVAAFLPLLYGIENSAVFINIAFVVMVATIAITAIGMNVKLSRVVTPTLPAFSGSIARSGIFRKSMAFTAIGFAIAAGAALAYDGASGGQVFGQYTAIFEKTLPATSIKQIGEEGIYFFDSSASEQDAAKLYGPGEIVSYRWDFGDGSTSAEKQAVHSYANPGKYSIKLTLVRSDGIVYTEELTVTTG